VTQKLVKIRDFCDIIKASLAKQILDDYGIKAILENQNTAGIFSGLCAVSKINLYVTKDKANQALQLLNSSVKQDD